MNKLVYPKVSGIYKITSPSGKVYIGQSVNLWIRQRSYRKNISIYQRKIYNSVKKYGWINHIFEVIKLCTPDKLTYWEQYYIDEYDSCNNKVGLNIRGAGHKGSVSDETKKLISQKNIGKPNKKSGESPRSIKVIQYDKNGQWLAEWNCINDIQVQLGFSRPNICKCLKGKIGSAYGYIWRYKNESISSKMFIYRESGRKKRPIIQLNPDLSFVKEWNYINQIEKELGFSRPNICKVCNGKQKTAYGFIWKYKSEVI